MLRSELFWDIMWVLLKMGPSFCYIVLTMVLFELLSCKISAPDNKVHVVYMGPTWGRQDPGGPHVGPMNLAIGGAVIHTQTHTQTYIYIYIYIYI